MKNEVVAMCNSRVTVREEYETAERAHERFKELVNALVRVAATMVLSRLCV